MAPSVLLVPGAFHRAMVLQPLAAELRSAGYGTVVTAPLASTADGTKSMGDDIRRIREQVVKLIDGEKAGIEDPEGIVEGKEGQKLTDPREAAAEATRSVNPSDSGAGHDVLVFLHSLAGLSGSAALGGLSKTERAAAGKKGGIVGVVCLAAFIPQEGEFWKTVLGGQWTPWQGYDEKTNLVTVIHDPIPIFYGDVASDEAQRLAKAVAPQAASGITPAVPPVTLTTSAFDGRRAYIFCMDDGAVPTPAQKGIIAGSGVQWAEHEMGTSHSPFASATKELVKVIQGFDAEFQKV